jgi:hypothetical protein
MGDEEGATEVIGLEDEATAILTRWVPGNVSTSGRLVGCRGSIGISRNLDRSFDRSIDAEML